MKGFTMTTYTWYQYTNRVTITTYYTSYVVQLATVTSMLYWLLCKLIYHLMTYISCLNIDYTRNGHCNVTINTNYQEGHGPYRTCITNGSCNYAKIQFKTKIFCQHFKTSSASCNQAKCVKKVSELHVKRNMIPSTTYVATMASIRSMCSTC